MTRPEKGDASDETEDGEPTPTYEPPEQSNRAQQKRNLP